MFVGSWSIIHDPIAIFSKPKYVNIKKKNKKKNMEDDVVYPCISVLESFDV